VSSVAWEAAGHVVTLRSESGLAPCAEAIGSALLFATAAAGADLALSDPVDPTWRAGALAAAAVARRWWGWRPPALVGPVGNDGPPGHGVVLAFTGGIDSFHSLLCGAQRPGSLLYVVGFDVPADDRPRLDDLLPRLQAVADARSLELVLVETDLRCHPLFAATSWESTHGGALAAVGHAVGAGTLLLSASASTGLDRPWGTHPDLDRHWSSSRTAVRHAGFGPSRFEKAAAIGHHPLVRQHLQVCFRRTTSMGNCGRCTKCVMTMAALDAIGALESSVAFPAGSAAELADRIDALAVGAYPTSRDEALAATRRPDVAAALVRLSDRMPRRPPSASAWGPTRVARARAHHAVGRRTPEGLRRWRRARAQPPKTGSRFSK
jgi:hypothetical protein